MLILHVTSRQWVEWIDAHKYNIEYILTMIPIWKPLLEKQPLAIVLDVDEVLLCNIRSSNPLFYVEDAFKGWGRGNPLNPAMDKALEVLNLCKKENIKIFLISERKESTRDETILNFEKVGFASLTDDTPFNSNDLKDPNGILQMCPDDEYPKDIFYLHPITNIPIDGTIKYFKENIRQKISQEYHIIANIGDQQSDLGKYGDVQFLIPHLFYYVS
jgi:predicted secreted acid phosphatase